MIEPINARALLDIFRAMPNEEQRLFVTTLGGEVTAEALYLMLHQLDQVELKKFTDRFFQEIAWQMFPILLRDARQLAREQPDLSDEEFDRLFFERIRDAGNLYDQQIADLERAKLKGERDRHPDPETIRRNLEICDLRRSDPQKYSQKKLAGQFNVTQRYIRQVIKDESKWRRLAAGQQS